jgi:acyl carrier protein
MPLPEPASVPEHSDRLRTSEDIKVWLLSRIAELCSVSPEAVDIHRPFSEFGLDSLETVNLMMELEDWLGRELEETIAWDYPTVDAIATHLGTSTKAA